MHYNMSAYGDTVGPGRAVCYKSVTNAAGTGCGAPLPVAHTAAGWWQFSRR